MTTPRALKLIAPLLAAAALIGAAPAGAHSVSCPSETGTITTAHADRIWHHGDSLYGCVTKSAHTLVTRRLGPWTPSTRVVFDGDDVVWTTRHTTAAGQVVDRAWAEEIIEDDRWLSGTPLVPTGPGHPFADARVQRLLGYGAAAGWVTTTGQVVLAVAEPNGSANNIGATLPQPSVFVKQLFLVGTFTSEPVATLAASAKLTVNDNDSDGDECGGVDAYDLTVVPSPGAPFVGGEVDSDWENTTGPCA